MKNFRKIVNKSMNDEQLFDSIADKYDTFTGIDEVRLHILNNRRNMINKYMYRDVNFGSILEFGVGTGVLLNEITATRKVGIDLSEKMCEVTRNRFDHIKTIKGDILIYKDDKKYDNVFCSAFLHHIAYNSMDELEKAVLNMKATLKDKGRIIILESNPYNPYWYLFMRQVGEFNAKLLSMRGLCDLLIENNIKLIKYKYYGFMPNFCPKWAFKTFKALESIIERIPILRMFLCSHYIIIGER